MTQYTLHPVSANHAEKQEVENLIDVNGAAEMLDCSPAMVRKMVRSQEIPHVMIGSRPKFLPSVLHDWCLDRIRQSTSRPESAA